MVRNHLTRKCKGPGAIRGLFLQRLIRCPGIPVSRRIREGDRESHSETRKAGFDVGAKAPYCGEVGARSCKIALAGPGNRSTVKGCRLSRREPQRRIIVGNRRIIVAEAQFGEASAVERGGTVGRKLQ